MPLKVDYSELSVRRVCYAVSQLSSYSFDVLAFFAGDLDGASAYDDLAEQIASAGRDWAQRHWRVADMQACACARCACTALTLAQTPPASPSNGLARRRWIARGTCTSCEGVIRQKRVHGYPLTRSSCP